MNKKIYALLMSALLSFGVINCAFADDFAIDENGNARLETSTFLPKGTRVSVMLLTPDTTLEGLDLMQSSSDAIDSILAVNQVLSEQDGGIEYNYTFPRNAKSGTYTVCWSIYGTNETKSLSEKYVNQERMETGKTKLSQETDKKAVLDEYATDIDIDSGEKYIKLTEAEKKYVTSKIGNSDKACEDFENAINILEIFKEVKNTTNKDSQKLFEENVQKMDVSQANITKYNALSTSKRTQVFLNLQKALKNETTPDSVNKDLENALSKITDDNGTSGGGSSGGSSSKDSAFSGGGGSGIISNVSNDTNNMELLPIPENSGVFEDVDVTYWAYPAIMKLYEKGVILGKDETHFCPNDAITREELVKIVVGAFEFYDDVSGKELSFDDVSKQAWYYESVARAVDKNIIKGISENLFGSGQNVTRQDMAVIIKRAVDADNVAEIYNVDSEKTLTDIDEISDYALEDVLVMIRGNIINGMDDGSFNPKGTATRAQVAQIIYKILYK